MYNASRAVQVVVTFLYSASTDQVARLWNVETGEVKREYSGHQKAIICLAFKDDMTDS